MKASSVNLESNLETSIYVPTRARRAGDLTVANGRITFGAGQFTWAFKSRTAGQLALEDREGVVSIHDIDADATYIFGAKAVVVAGSTIALSNDTLMIYW
jgi:hypothetical protein